MPRWLFTGSSFTDFKILQETGRVLKKVLTTQIKLNLHNSTFINMFKALEIPSDIFSDELNDCGKSMNPML